MRSLYVNGCSMAYGDELDVDKREQQAWPFLLQKSMNFEEVMNDAIPGGSNDRIVRRTLKYVSEYVNSGKSLDDLFIVISWSLPLRREFGVTDLRHRPDEKFYLRFLPSLDNFQKTDFVKFHNILYSQLQTDRESEVRFRNQILMLQSFLEARKIKYVFTKGLTSMWCADLSKNDLEELRLLDKMIDTKNFYGYERDLSFIADTRFVAELPVGEGGHPLAEGHARWAVVVEEFIRSCYEIH